MPPTLNVKIEGPPGSYKSAAAKWLTEHFKYLGNVTITQDGEKINQSFVDDPRVNVEIICTTKSS
jgi:ABC-type multidrug transport system fused ATPase/permease subunit